MDNSKLFINLGVITGDDFCFLLAAEAKRRQKFQKRPFNFHSFAAPHYKKYFRFEKEDISRLKDALEIPDIVTVSNGSQYDGLECKLFEI